MIRLAQLGLGSLWYMDKVLFFEVYFWATNYVMHIGIVKDTDQ